MPWWKSLLDGTLTTGLLLLPIVASGILGYVVGSAKSFREQKLRAYEEILPIFIRVAFNPAKADEPEFNKALIKLWLFGSRDVALKVDHAIALLLHPERGNQMEALQAAISGMRSDIQGIQILPRRKKIRPSEVSHFYTRLKTKNDEGPNESPQRTGEETGH